MAVKWQPLLGTKHAMLPPERREAASAHLFTLPDRYELNSENSQRLMVPVTEHEELETINRLGAYKAAGPDQLGDDFYRDWAQGGLQHGPSIRVHERTLKPVFACIPGLTKLIRPDMGDAPWAPTRRHIKRKLRAVVWQQGLEQRAARQTKWREDDDRILEILSKTKWSQMLLSPGYSTQDSQLWHRLRLHQLLLWHKPTPPQCPRPECTLPYDATTGHIVWRCTAARLLWRQLLQHWTATTPTDDDRDVIFSLDAPVTDRDWDAGLRLGGGLSVEIDERMDHWLRILWRLLVTCAVQRLWGGQARLHFPLQHRWTDDFHAVMDSWQQKCHHIVEGIIHSGTPTSTADKRMVLAILQLLRSDALAVPRFQLAAAHYLLFFDGGSRGNPGPGGSGAIVVRVTDRIELLWASSMSHNSRFTTNNVAEFQGLCHGLAALQRYNWHPATIIGDSEMIISLLRRRKSPSSARLKALYARAAALARKIFITGWKHHYRDTNKMADKAANIAMDSKTSVQAHATSGRQEFHTLRAWLHADVRPWLDARLHGTEALASSQ